MFKVLCLLAMVVLVSAGISQPSAAFHRSRIVRREAIAPAEPKEAIAPVEDKDDMEKAETFGFGYHKVIHVYPSYYPEYYGYGYPGYYHNYYGPYY